MQPIPLHPSTSLLIHPSPHSSASLTFDQKGLGRLNQRGGQGEAGGTRKHTGARKQSQMGQGARKETRKESQEAGSQTEGRVEARQRKGYTDGQEEWALQTDSERDVSGVGRVSRE